MIARTLAVCVLLTTVASGVSAADVVFAHPLGPAELRQLTAVATVALANTPVVRGQFVQRRYLRELPRPLEARGEFLYARGVGIEWHTLAPFDSRLVLTAAGIRQSSGNDTARVDAQEQPALRAVGRVFFGLFALDFDSLARDFRTFGVAESNHWRVGLQPRRAALRHLFDDAVLAGSNGVESVVLQDAAGDRTEILLQKLQYDPQPLTAADRARF